MKIKEIKYLPSPTYLTDKMNGSLDVLVVLEDLYCKDGFCYCFHLHPKISENNPILVSLI